MSVMVATTAMVTMIPINMASELIPPSPWDVAVVVVEGVVVGAVAVRVVVGVVDRVVLMDVVWVVLVVVSCVVVVVVGVVWIFPRNFGCARGYLSIAFESKVGGIIYGVSTIPSWSASGCVWSYQ